MLFRIYTVLRGDTVKQCINCGKKAEDNIKKCSKCGCSDFKKVIKSKTKKEFIILAVIIVLVATLSVILSSIGKEEKTVTTTTTGTTSATTETATKKETTTAFEHKGDYVGNVYSNEWIGLKVNIPEGYKNTTDELETNGNSILAYDIAIEDESGKKDISRFTLHFSSCEKEEYWTDYVEYHKDGKELMENLKLKEIEGVKPTDRIKIAEEEYLSITGTSTVTGEVFVFAYRKIENRVIAIMISGKTLDAVNSFTDSMEKI